MISIFGVLFFVLLPAGAEGGVSATPDTASPLQVIRVDTTIVAPVVLAQDTIFYLQAGTRGLSAPTRVETTSRRILEVAESSISLDSLRLEDSGVTTDILA